MKNWFSGSIFGLILWRIVLTTLAFIAIMAVIIYTQIDQTLLILRDRSLENTAQDIGSYLEKTEEGTAYLDMPATDRKFYAEAGRFYQYIVRGPDRQILFTSPIAYSDRFPNDYNDQERFFDFYGPLGTHFLGTSMLQEYEGKQYLIQVAQSESTVDALSDTLASVFLNRIFLYSAPFMLALTAVIFISLRQSLKPLLEVSRQARRIGFEKPEIRLDTRTVPQEIRPLVDAVNSALERLEGGIRSQQEFTANVAHELRTPLTILKARSETLEDKAGGKKLGKDIETMIHAVNQMLDLSKLDFPEAIGMDNIDLSEVVKAVCKDLWPLFIKQERELIVSGVNKPVTIRGNRDLIYRALRNLLDNALAHTPAKTPVEVGLKERSVIISDHGSPIPASEREIIFRRFHRSDRQKFKLGAGLGLSIVGKTMKIHGGKIALDDPAGETGNTFRLEFPAP